MAGFLPRKLARDDAFCAAEGARCGPRGLVGSAVTLAGSGVVATVDVEVVVFVLVIRAQERGTVGFFFESNLIFLT